MTALAFVNQVDPLRRSVDVWIGDETESGITQWFGDGTIKFTPHGEWAEPPRASLTMKEDMARALLQALLNYYHGGDDTRALRKDYDAERARVDKMMDALVRGVIR